MIWSLYNKLLGNIGQKETYLHQKIINDMISILIEEEKNCNHLVEAYNRLQLRVFKDSGITKVSILSIRDGLCKEGEDLDGQEYLLIDALKDCPIPAASCEKKLCKCIFIANV